MQWHYFKFICKKTDFTAVCQIYLLFFIFKIRKNVRTYQKGIRVVNRTHIFTYNKNIKEDKESLLWKILEGKVEERSYQAICGLDYLFYNGEHVVQIGAAIGSAAAAMQKWVNTGISANVSLKDNEFLGQINVQFDPKIKGGVLKDVVDVVVTKEKTESEVAGEEFKKLGSLMNAIKKETT